MALFASPGAAAEAVDCVTLVAMPVHLAAGARGVDLRSRAEDDDFMKAAGASVTRKSWKLHCTTAAAAASLATWMLSTGRQPSAAVVCRLLSAAALLCTAPASSDTKLALCAFDSQQHCAKPVVVAGMALLLVPRVPPWYVASCGHAAPSHGPLASCWIGCWVMKKSP
jgi:hypothetical protein